MTKEREQEMKQMEKLLTELREACEFINDCYKKMDLTFQKILEENPDMKGRWEEEVQNREKLKQEEKEQEDLRKEDVREAEKGMSNRPKVL